MENARDLTKKTSLPLTVGHYLNNMALLTNQWNSKNYKDHDRQRIYLKDIDSPTLWSDKLREMIPLGLYYLNDSVGDLGGPGAVDEPNPHGPGSRRGRGIAKSGDLMSSLPPEMRAENLMCYIGHEGTYTPAHREMCASLGQNIMIETSTGSAEDGKSTRPGSSIWFMTETKERHVVSEYWLSTLGHDIEVENHFAQVNAWKTAPFKVYVVEQRVGDFILIPPLAPHQVWNRGTRTMKVAWNRTTVETLEMALDEALPRARLVCRDEQYKNKAIVFHTLQGYSRLLDAAAALDQNKQNRGSKVDARNFKVRQLEKDFRRLQALFTKILLSESFLQGNEERQVEMVPFDGNITCSYCRCNIFNRFLTCKNCVGELPDGSEDTYDICMECYAMGRSCACISRLTWCEQWSWGDLTSKHDRYRHQIIRFEGKIMEKTPGSLKMEMNKLGKTRTLAQICQLELKRRPWRDIKKPLPEVEGEEIEEPETDIHGNPKKKRKVRRSEKFKREHKACHVDKAWEPKWKQAECTECGYSFCYGTLFRGYDMMPQTVLENPDWKCPRCRNICSCRDCRKKPGWSEFVPSGTVLGHDTKKIADPRSVESLVDFSFSNLAWIQKMGDDHRQDSKRLRDKQAAAAKAKAKDAHLGENYVDEHDDVEGNLLRLAEHEGIPIDPALDVRNTTLQFESDSQEDEIEYNDHPEECLGMAAGSKEPPPPQYTIPAGGIIRDADHAYDMTEAITYDYPDPDVGVHVAVESESAVEPGKEEPPPGYEAAGSPKSPPEIAMTSAKRKRSKLDDGDRPYNTKKSMPNSSQKKKGPRRSLVVKLPIDKVKLAEINKAALIAKRALNVDGAPEDDAPVVSSDLRALNSWDTADLQAPVKKKRVEMIVEEVDRDFIISTRRDRRTAIAREAEEIPSRRTTRTHLVTYEVPTDEEEAFGEAVPVKSVVSQRTIRGSTNGKQTSEDGDSDSGLSVNEDDMDVDDNLEASLTPAKKQTNGDLSIRRFADFNKESPLREDDSELEDVSEIMNREPQPSVTQPTRSSAGRNVHFAGKAPKITPTAPKIPIKSASKSNAMVERAAANRQAKLALAHEYQDDDGDRDDSLDSSNSARGSSASSAQQETTHSSHTLTKAQAILALKAFANDWEDDESDDDPPVSERSRNGPQSGGWATINRDPAATQTAKPKGRPPRVSM